MATLASGRRRQTLGYQLGITLRMGFLIIIANTNKYFTMVALPVNSYGFGIKSYYMVFNTNGGYSFDYRGTATRMVIDLAGNVGIGTTTPGGQFELSLDQGRKPAVLIHGPLYPIKD